ncbi:MAG: ABC transporter ATP-binding protein [Gemmatimonadales bacterium]|nr:ABC transporter ATP-binding protein [Gemmatimonadales bacterium]
MIEVVGLTRRFGNTLALDDLCFSVGEGEVVGFLGPNGAGKSTTMKILTCSLAPSSGTAKVGGHDVLDEPISVRRRVGFLPEQVALYPEQKVNSLLRFVAEIKGIEQTRLVAEMDRVIDLTGLGAVVYKPAGHLSHGYRKRVGLAQALIGDPDVLILDEPSSGLDPQQIVEIRELIRSFRGQRTVLLSSHILTEVSEICERVLILDHGRLVGQDSTERLASAGLSPVSGRQVTLSWDGDREAVLKALAQVAGVEELRATEQGAEVVIAGNPVEIRPKLVDSVLAAGGKLQNIQDIQGIPDKGPSLEDLFLRLTGADRELRQSEKEGE